MMHLLEGVGFCNLEHSPNLMLCYYYTNIQTNLACITIMIRSVSTGTNLAVWLLMQFHILPPKKENEIFH